MQSRIDPRTATPTWTRIEGCIDLGLDSTKWSKRTILKPNPTVALTPMPWKIYRNGHVMRIYTINSVDYHINRFVEARPSRKHYCQSRQFIAVFFIGGSFCSLPAQYYTYSWLWIFGLYNLDLGYWLSRCALIVLIVATELMVIIKYLFNQVQYEPSLCFSADTKRFNSAI